MKSGRPRAADLAVTATAFSESSMTDFTTVEIVSDYTWPGAISSLSEYFMGELHGTHKS